MFCSKFKKDYDVIMKLNYITKKLLEEVEKKHYNLEEVFEKIGYSKSTLRKLQKDKTYFPSLTLILKISRETGIQLQDICNLDEFKVTEEMYIEAHKTLLKILKRNAAASKKNIIKAVNKYDTEMKKEILELTVGYL